MTLLYPNSGRETAAPLTLALDFSTPAQSLQERSRVAVARHIDKDPAAYRAKCRAHEIARLNTDPMFRESKRQRNVLRAAVSRIKEGLPTGYFYRLGYKGESLRAHLEGQWAAGWSWDNYGAAWTIDHIKPVSEFLKEGCFDSAVIHALDNLRPMDKFLNESKHSKDAPTAPTYAEPKEKCHGERHHLAKLTTAQASEIKRRLQSPRHGLLSELAREYGVVLNTIDQIRKGKSWKDA